MDWDSRVDTQRGRSEKDRLDGWFLSVGEVSGRQSTPNRSLWQANYLLLFFTSRMVVFAKISRVNENRLQLKNPQEKNE